MPYETHRPRKNSHISKKKKKGEKFKSHKKGRDSKHLGKRHGKRGRPRIISNVTETLDYYDEEDEEFENEKLPNLVSQKQYIESSYPENYNEEEL